MFTHRDLRDEHGGERHAVMFLDVNDLGRSPRDREAYTAGSSGLTRQPPSVLEL